ncbi:APC membrane recruitment protein 2 isoform X1 [Cyprinodon tularosa]|uniref:APC membrane recruitment protein 2 isoform X1 n=1 Tax=Cyprinodon tularosa TaxID=77115 RepID=UPI0018E2330E|nr:APC membrane recruitment protein 2 isoform X1 [Cyprinodon tularosa]
MDVQTENMDPPPNESQPTGKIRKGFKLFGKRKPGNIFSIRKKGDGNNKSSVSRSKTSEGLSETSTQDSEQEQDKENGKEVKQEDGEQPEDEALGEDDALATAPARTSISSASSAKSLSFLSLLRGGRRAVGDRRAQTVTQPPARQRRGLKGLFSNVKLRSRDKEDKEEAPPSPLLQSSRTNSVEIIKDDMTLTPKCQPRTLDSSETESTEPVQSSTTQESSAMTASKTPAPQVKSAETVSPTKEHVSPLLTPEPPLVPGDNSLSSLLADISSLLTFDSISGGGDIMADVEAEWGKVSSALNANVPVSSTSPFSKPTLSSSTTTSSTVSSTATVKPSSVAVSSSSFTLTSHPVKLSSDSIPATMQGKQTPAPSLTKPSTAPSSSATSSISKTIQSTPSSTTTTPPANASATVEKVSSFSPTLTSTANYMATEIAPNKAPVSKPDRTSISPAVSSKPVAETYSPPIPITQPPTNSSFNLEKSTYIKSQSSAVGESKDSLASSVPSTNKTTSPHFAPVISSKITSFTASTTTSGSASVAPSKPTLTPNHLDLNKTVSDPGPYSTSNAAIKTQVSPASVPSPSSASLDKIPPTTKPTAISVALDKMPAVQRTETAPLTHVAPTSSATASAPDQIKVSPANIPIPASKEPPSPTPIDICQSKICPAPLKVPVSVSKDQSVPVKMQESSSKCSTFPVEIPNSLSKELSTHVKMQESSSKVLTSPAEIPVSVSKTPPAPAQTTFSGSKTPVASSIDSPHPESLPVSPPAPVSQPKTPEPQTASAPPVSWQIDAPSSANVRGSVQASPDSPDGAGEQVIQGLPSKTKEQLPPKEKKTSQSKATGLSKIPVVGGGRVSRQPVREAHHYEPSKDPTSPVVEEKHGFNSHSAAGREKMVSPEANAPASKHHPVEHQQPQQSKVVTSSARDSKIPLKHDTQFHAASQVSQTKEPPRTKIPVSKVPVRRAANKPATTGSSMQIRK